MRPLNGSDSIIVNPCNMSADSPHRPNRVDRNISQSYTGLLVTLAAHRNSLSVRSVPIAEARSGKTNVRS